MGSTGALGMKECVDDKLINLDTALLWHLQSNHYPPIPSSIVIPCKKAIKYANKGLWNIKVRLPVGITYKGYKTASVWDLIEKHHLVFFLDHSNNDDWEDEPYEEK